MQPCRTADSKVNAHRGFRADAAGFVHARWDKSVALAVSPSISQGSSFTLSMRTHGGTAAVPYNGPGGSHATITAESARNKAGKKDEMPSRARTRLSHTPTSDREKRIRRVDVRSAVLLVYHESAHQGKCALALGHERTRCLKLRMDTSMVRLCLQRNAKDGSIFVGLRRSTKEFTNEKSAGRKSGPLTG